MLLSFEGVCRDVRVNCLSLVFLCVGFYLIQMGCSCYIVLHELVPYAH